MGISILLLLLLAVSNVFAQLITPNDGFEGQPRMAIPPGGWNNCNDGNSSADTQPGYFSNQAPASEGKTYISLVTRSISTPGTVETVWAELNRPFEKEKCYELTIDARSSDQFKANFQFDDYYFNSPFILQVIGFNGDCKTPETSELLWQSDIINFLNWQQLHIFIRPLKDTYRNIAIRPYFTQADNFQNSVAFLDNMRPVYSEDLLTFEEGLIRLPDDATSIRWYFNGVLLPGEINKQLVFKKNGQYLASFYNSEGCLKYARGNFQIDFQLIKYYPTPTFDQVLVEFASSDNFQYHYRLFDATGRLVKATTLNANTGSNKFTLDLSQFAAGIYHLYLDRPGYEQSVIKLIRLVY
ncbi:MAG: T9SS type A sorting domain-containing protein [Bacteroidia bacterium]|nr:T9SS type A sorting domain-containing protein [Bacteroidia bacterium]